MSNSSVLADKARDSKVNQLLRLDSELLGLPQFAPTTMFFRQVIFVRLSELLQLLPFLHS